MSSDKFKTVIENHLGIKMEISYIDANGAKITERQWELYNWTNITSFTDLVNTRRWLQLGRRESDI